MAVTKRSLNALGIHNPHNLAERGGGLMLFIAFYSANSEPNNLAKWLIFRVNTKVVPDAPWFDNYGKAFVCFPVRTTKETKRFEAVAWASAKYNVTDWERSPFGSWHPKGTIAAALKQGLGES